MYKVYRKQCTSSRVLEVVYSSKQFAQVTPKQQIKATEMYIASGLRGANARNHLVLTNQLETCHLANL